MCGVRTSLAQYRLHHQRCCLVGGRACSTNTIGTNHADTSGSGLIIRTSPQRLIAIAAMAWYGLSRVPLLLGLMLGWAILTVTNFIVLSSESTPLTALFRRSPSTGILALVQYSSLPTPTVSRNTALHAFKTTAHPVKAVCRFDTIDLMMRSHQYFAVSFYPSHSQSEGHGLSLEIEWSCQPPADTVQPRAYFRVHTQNTSMTALMPSTTVLHSDQRSLTVFLPIPDPGLHIVHVRLLSLNLTDDHLFVDWPSHAKIDWNTLTSRWVDKDIVGSPYTYHSPGNSRTEVRPPVSYDSILTTERSPYQLPLCFSDSSVNNTLYGRWITGSQHEHITHPWLSRSIYDDYNPLFVPFDCHVDYTASLIEGVRKVRWFQIIGDSNMRALFERLCYIVNGTEYKGDPKVSYMDLPQLCLIDGGQSVITFNNWFYGKGSVFHHQLGFRQQCEKYTENVTQIISENTIYGWPNCRLVHESVQSMGGPGLVYFSWGSHAAEAGITTNTWSFVDGPELFGLEYFRKYPTLIAMIEDVYATIIPYAKGPQYLYRNNERIESFNAMLVRSVRRHWQSWPIDMLDADTGAVVAGLSPIFDVFHPTHAASEVIHGDAVHFYWEIEIQIARWIAHWMKHAPQLNNKLRRKPASAID